MEKAKAYKIELLVVDFENFPEDEIIYLLENVRHLYPSVMSIQSKEINDWDDDHPLNNRNTAKQAYKEMFE